jgi:hypothetical protein
VGTVKKTVCPPVNSTWELPQMSSSTSSTNSEKPPFSQKKRMQPAIFSWVVDLYAAEVVLIDNLCKSSSGKTKKGR